MNALVFLDDRFLGLCGYSIFLTVRTEDQEEAVLNKQVRAFQEWTTHYLTHFLPLALEPESDASRLTIHSHGSY